MSRDEFPGKVTSLRRLPPKSHSASRLHVGRAWEDAKVCGEWHRRTVAPKGHWAISFRTHAQNISPDRSRCIPSPRLRSGSCEPPRRRGRFRAWMAKRPGHVLPVRPARLGVGRLSLGLEVCSEHAGITSKCRNCSARLVDSSEIPEHSDKLRSTRHI